MASGIVIHIAAGAEKHTEVLTSERIRIGPSHDSDLRLELPSDDADTPSLELIHTNNSYLVANYDNSLGITLNGAPIVKGATLADGDLINFATSDISLQFFPLTATASAALAAPPRTAREAYVAPFIEQAAIESAATARRDDAKVFLREFTRELIREINPSTKILALLLTFTLVGGILYLGFAAFRELQRSRRLINDQTTQIAALMTTLSKTKEEIKGLDENNRAVNVSLSLGYTLRSSFGNGVCLIYGTYQFFDAAGRPLRHPEARVREDGGDDGAGDFYQLTPEGRGSIAEFEFNGTGFHVGNGLVLTNRHVVQAWTSDERSQALSSSVNGKARLTKLVAYFPTRNQAFPLKLRRVAKQEEDLAVCSLDNADLTKDLPILPLDQDTESVAIGKVVVMMGYAGGIFRLLAALPESESRSIQERYSSIEALSNFLASQKMITPQTTQGHITDLYARRIAYDAPTGEGGSGSPVFGPSGRVIGVNFAVFTESTASNFAVPIRFAIPLLEQSGWVAPEAGGEKTSSANNLADGHTASVQTAAQ